MRTSRLLLLALLFLALQVLRSAWLCDDAFITLRTVDHFVHGRGLVWNLGERVQVYTHPLWMFALSGIYGVIRNPSVSLYVLSGLTTIAFVALLVRIHASSFDHNPDSSRWGLVLALVAAGSSKAFVEYSTSGLENPLTHLLLACAYGVHLGRRGAAERLGPLTLWVSLIALNRLDSVLLVAPALALDAWSAARTVGLRRTLRTLLLGLSPFFAWELFSLFYYGFPFPNTAYAKLSTGLPRTWYLRQGVRFLLITSRTDPASAATLLVGLFLALRARSWSLLASMVLYLLYVLWVGGGFMVGRFLTPPIALALIAIARAPAPRPRPFALATAGILLLAALQPYSPLRLWMHKPAEIKLGYGIIDERNNYAPDTALFGRANPAGPGGTEAARTAREQATMIDPDIPGSQLVAQIAIGFFGFYADPRQHILDPCALAEPLLARIPVEHPEKVRIGHFLRAAPAGFMPSIVSGENRIADPDLARFWGPLRTVISGPLLDFDRLKAIVSVNLGPARRGLKAYNDKVLATPELGPQKM